MISLNKSLLFTSIISSSFLLFMMEPMVGRMVVPFFGGAAHVWTTCLMVFQGLLFCGYLYAHYFGRQLGMWHLAVILMPVLLLPLDFQAVPFAEAPIKILTFQLLKQIALPFFALSTTAVVIQVWYLNTAREVSRNPYWLYAVSNAGSLMALLSYPFIIEPLTGLTIQKQFWSAGYLLFVAVMALTWWRLKPVGNPLQTKPVEKKSGSPANQVKWLLLSTLTSALLLSATNHVATEVGSFPLIWVIPLVLFLSSFILAFSGYTAARNYWPFLFSIMMIAAFSVDDLGEIALFYFFYFMVCWLLHGELYRLRPPPAGMTGYYLWISLGGWAGSLLIALLAPIVFQGLYEFVFCMLLASVMMYCQRGLPDIFLIAKVPVWLGGPKIVTLVAAAVPLTLWAAAIFDSGNLVLATHRNFYGTYTIREMTTATGARYRELMHGSTSHGTQYTAPLKKHFPLAYFHRDGSLHQTKLLFERPVNMGVIGLGCGSMAAWMQKGDRLTYYEIDADNEGIARRWFTFLDDSPAAIRVKTGDARLKLAADVSGDKFDIIIIDAFSGDSIPIHLLTREAIETYLSRLTDMGLLVFHTSNRYYDIRCVLKAAARDLKLYALWTNGFYLGKSDPLYSRTAAFVMSKDSERLNRLQANKTIRWSRIEAVDGIPNVKTWTDDYVNILIPIAERLRSH